MEYWTVYWFQSIACFTFATAATFSGITGAALMLPWFIMGFAFLGVPEITTQQAIAAALFLETAAFSIGIYRYARRGFIDTATAKKLAPVAVPSAILGALLAHWAPERALQVAYSVMMLGIAWILVRAGRRQVEEHQSCPQGKAREMNLPTGGTYRFCAHGLRLQRPISWFGAFMTGLISTGVGELTSPLLIARSGFPVPVAAATSIILVAVADISAVLTHFTWFVATEGLGAIPWNLIVWGVPGMAAGAFLGSHLQGRVSEDASRRFFAGLFVVISLAFLAFALFGK